MPLTVMLVRKNTLHLCLLVLACAWSTPAWSAAPAVDSVNVPWKVKQTAHAVYPPAMMQRGIAHGDAQVRVSIDVEGRLLDALLVLATQREFGEEAMRVVKLWRFEAARVNGAAMGVVGDLSFAFSVDGPVAVNKFWPVSKEDEKALLDPSAYRAEELRGLDRIPTPTHVEQPVYSKSWSEKGITGTATVDFYIDETGKVRVPVVTDASHPLLAGSALAAVSQWTFEPPLRGGKPVLAHAEQVLTFQPVKK